MDKKTAATQIEEERLFGADVDLFKSYHAVKFLHNILKAIGLRYMGL